MGTGHLRDLQRRWARPSSRGGSCGRVDLVLPLLTVKTEEEAELWVLAALPQPSP